ncbi:Flp family type IVb pilin [Novosphingobium aerophilum]|uniref:Flp family type IVb pilin n=1 Tax=Novosphingobium aerophilum TaxID=2839843 RepID=UPI001BE4BF2D|nr:Flp family type IVb pilin [Novosphingobium aerophilum]
MIRWFIRLRRDRRGATAMEYGLIAALIAVAAMTILSGMGSQLNTTFSRTSSGLARSGGTSPPVIQ